MGLRRQLLLFGCLSLALPWAGIQYVREMESTLRYGQAMALQATAQAVAARLASDESLATRIVITRPGPANQADAAGRTIYAHPTTVRLPMDGYEDDWRNLDHDWQKPMSLGAFRVSPQMMVAKRADDLHLFITVTDPARQFFNPSESGMGADRVELYLASDDTGVVSRFRLYTAAPGPVLVESSVQPGAWARDYRIQAVWDEREQGYAMEIKLPFSLAQQGMTVAVVDGQSWRDRSWLAPTSLPQLITRDETLDAVLNIFSPTGTRLYLVNPEGWIVASAGELDRPSVRAGFAHMQHQWLRKLLGQGQFDPLEEADRGGAFTSEAVMSAMGLEGRGDQSSAATSWHSLGDGAVGLTVQPVMGADGQPLGAVIAEQTTDSVNQLTSGAAGRLLLYSILAALAAALGLLGFASVLSYRVRRLSLQAQAAVDRDGRIAATFSGSRRNDELGELSRQYAALLDRLRTYTQYLETLASRLSHELRTPLAIVRTSLDNLSQADLKSEAQAYCARAISGSERLSLILNAMSAAARLEQSINSNDVETVDLREMLPHVIAAYGDLYSPTPITLVIRGEYSANAQIAPELFVQMLDKLVENAVDFGDAEHGVEVRLLCQSRQLILQVANHGAPIAESMLKTIFDPLVTARTPVVEGAHAPVDGAHHLGLGLYIVRLIAQFHGATLRAVNEEGAGIVYFEVILPPGTAHQ